MKLQNTINVIENTTAGPILFDLPSRLMQNRIIMLDSEINEETATSVIEQMLYLDKVSPKEDITLYINSPGGTVTDGLAIYDTMNFIRPDVRTVCIGQACSMAAILLSSGTKGKRYCLPNASVMIHQPSGGAYGMCTDIQLNVVARYKEKLTRILATNVGKDYETVLNDCERDKYFMAEDALAYGLVDKIKVRKSVD